MDPWTLGLVVAVPLAAAAGYLAGRRGRKAVWRRPGAALTERLLPDPALRWLAERHDATGVWVLDGAGTAPAAARYVAIGADPTDVEHRVEQLDRDGGEGLERLGAGLLLHHAADGTLAAMLVPGTPSAEAIDAARQSLTELVAGLTDRPAILPTREAPVAVETPGQVGVALANQVERLTGSAAAVVVNLGDGSQVVAVSESADRRLVSVRAAPDSPAGRVSRGIEGLAFTALDPLGSTINDRRRSSPSQVIPIGSSHLALGALVLWPAGRRELTGAVLAQVLEAVREAEPRLQTAKAFHDLKRTASTDPLTGLRNRRGLDEEMGRVGVAADEHGALIYADLDRFKNLNDSLGHPAGDAALVHFASIIRDLVRATDTGARLGGEEFAVWLPRANLALGLSIAERIRETLEKRVWTWQGAQWPVTASFGVAACPETSRSRLNLAAQADAALYRAKSGGRNRVESAEPIDGAAADARR